MGLLCRFVWKYRLEAEGNLLKWTWKPKNCLVIINDRQSSLSLSCTLLSLTLSFKYLKEVNNVDQQRRHLHCCTVAAIVVFLHLTNEKKFPTFREGGLNQLTPPTLKYGPGGSL